MTISAVENFQRAVEELAKTAISDLKTVEDRLAYNSAKLYEFSSKIEKKARDGRERGVREHDANNRGR